MLLWRLRALIFYAVITIFLALFFSFICFPLGLIGKATEKRMYKLSVIVSRALIWALDAIMGIDYKIEGMEILPKNFTAHLVLANHQSFWDNLFVQILIPEHSWVVKKELYKIPFFGWMLEMANPIAIDRSNIRSINQIVTKGKEKLDSGLSLILFPEGTRVSPRKTVKLKTSPAKLALAANVPVLLFVHNAGLFWPKGLWFKRSGTIHVKVLEIISAEEVAKHDVRSLTDYIENRLNTEKQLLIHETIKQNKVTKKKKPKRKLFRTLK